MKLSLYTYLFNATARSFDLDGALTNFAAFADEVIVATLKTQEDDTLDRLLAYHAQNDKIKVVVVNMDITRNNRFDGDLKTEALKRCSHPIRVIADCDERLVVGQRPLWDAAAEQLLANQHLDGLLIPVIDLYGHEDYIRADQQIGLKFRMHKDTIVRRGVPFWAEKGGGLFDTSQSDSTEPIRADRQLGSFQYLGSRALLQPNLCHMLANEPYVIHHGFLDLARRAKIGKEFWKEHWEKRSGREERVATDVRELSQVAVVKHGLNLA